MATLALQAKSLRELMSTSGLSALGLQVAPASLCPGAPHTKLPEAEPPQEDRTPYGAAVRSLNPPP